MRELIKGLDEKLNFKLRTSKQKLGLNRPKFILKNGIMKYLIQIIKSKEMKKPDILLSAIQ